MEDDWMISSMVVKAVLKGCISSALDLRSLTLFDLGQFQPKLRDLVFHRSCSNIWA